MGDLGGSFIDVTCSACGESFSVLIWRGDRLLKGQLCEPCRIRGFTIERNDWSAHPILRCNGAFVRTLEG